MRLGLPRCERTTTPNRVLAAIAVGLMVAFPVYALAYYGAQGAEPFPAMGPSEILAALLGMPLMAGMAALPALPVWAVLHGCRIHFPVSALAIGVLIGGGWSLTFPVVNPPAAIALMVAGAVSGLVIWRVAYGSFLADRRRSTAGEARTG